MNLDDYDWLILTSVNGVEAMWERLANLRLTKTALKHLRIAAIGPATKKAIEQRGVEVECRSQRICRGVRGTQPAESG